MKDPYTIIKNPITTEKAVRLMESQNKLTFITFKNATKKEIKEAVEQVFKVKIAHINTLITPQGTKKAYIRLSPETPALDVATQLGLI
jgi:large subunit ribosomal protein L23